MDGTSIFGAMQALQFGAQTVNGLLALKVSSEVQTKAIELNSQIIAAQGHIMAIQSDYAATIEEVKLLKEEIARMKSIGGEREKYILHQVERGAFAYILKPSVDSSEPAHWLCVQCFDNGHKKILSANKRVTGGREVEHQCPHCKNSITVHHRRRIQRLTEDELKIQIDNIEGRRVD